MNLERQAAEHLARELRRTRSREAPSMTKWEVVREVLLWVGVIGFAAGTGYLLLGL